MKLEIAAVDRISLTGHARSFAQADIIVSKTDTKGILTYVNDVFVNISGYEERELIGKPHSLIRHPHMPRCIFKLLWDTISNGQEIFAYVNNRCKNGDNYWVLAHVTPTLGPGGRIVGYHSSRRLPASGALAVIQPLYRQLYDEEQRQSTAKVALETSSRLLSSLISQSGKNYDQFILSL